VLNTVRLGAADGSISGRVTSADGNPLGNVVVSVRSGDIEQETTTPTAGNIGAFIVEELPTPRTYVITFTLEGFSSETIALDLLAGQRLTDVNAVLVGGTGTITGVVSDTAGVPLGGVTVTVTRGDFSAGTATLTTASDVSGVGGYEIAGIPTPGIYTVTFSAPGFVDETRIVRFLAPGLQAGSDAVMRRSQSTISGRVAEGLTGLPGVTVTLTDGLTSRTTTTASSPLGDYSFANVDPGTYTLTYALAGYRTEVVIVRMVAGEATVRNVAMVRT
jgi:Carboxypeptidase regulatory-like domain